MRTPNGQVKFAAYFHSLCDTAGGTDRNEVAAARPFAAMQTNV